MKQLIIACIGTLLLMSAFSQTDNPFPKTIQVTGSAETEIIPDEIYTIITLKEYDKKGVGKIDLEKIKAEFLSTCAGIGLPDSVVSIASYEGYNNYPWWRKRKGKDDLYASIAYQVKFSNSKTMDALVEKLNDDATQNFQVARVSHSKIQEYRKQLKIQAIKAAKEKGVYLAGAINETLGPAITIIEPDESTPGIYYNAIAGNAYYNFNADSTKWEQEKGVDFKNIRLKYEIKAVFALQ